jgi:hypothetical protein
VITPGRDRPAWIVCDGARLLFLGDARHDVDIAPEMIVFVPSLTSPRVNEALESLLSARPWTAATARSQSVSAGGEAKP